MNEEKGACKRFRLDLAYDGRGYDGWQSQAGGNTIQDILLESLQSICTRIKTVQGSGRTDAGVCAEAQVAHFDVPGDWRMTAVEWQKALNAKLPPQIRIFACREMPADFHSRFSATGKCYRYSIDTSPVLHPLRHGLAWHRAGLSDVGRLRRAAALFEGEHDFRSFSANRKDGKDETRDTVRTIERASVEEASSGRLEIVFEGNGFLYKMVRFLVGSCVYHAKGKLTQEEIVAFLEGKTPTVKAPYCAPPDGLTLVAVRYPVEFEGK